MKVSNFITSKLEAGKPIKLHHPRRHDNKTALKRISVSLFQTFYDAREANEEEGGNKCLFNVTTITNNDGGTSVAGKG